MAQKIINVGTSENSGDGDPLRLAFTKVNDNFTEVYGKLTVLEDGTVAQVQDTQGSIFGDDSTLLVDAINSKIVGPIENNSTAVFTGTVDFAGATVNNLTIQNYIGDLKGSVVGDDSTVIIDGVSSSVNLDGTVKGDIIPDTNVAYDIGSDTKRFKDLYLSGNTINLGGTALSIVAGKLQVGGTDVGAEYGDAEVDTHLNTSTASSGEVLSWTGSDYDWVAQSGGGSEPKTYSVANGDWTDGITMAGNNNRITLSHPTPFSAIGSVVGTWYYYLYNLKAGDQITVHFNENVSPGGGPIDLTLTLTVTNTSYFGYTYLLIDVTGHSFTDIYNIDSITFEHPDGYVALGQDPFPRLGGDLYTHGYAIRTPMSGMDLVLDPNGPGAVDVSTSKIINVVDPTDPQDAATKAYVDANAGGGGSSPLVESPSGTYTLTGNLVVSGDITSSSDETLKENIKSIEGALDTVTKLSGKMFTMKSDETQKEKVGFIAQEIEQHLPQVVSTDPNGTKSVSYGNVAALLVEAIKELNQKIEDLKK